MGRPKQSVEVTPIDYVLLKEDYIKVVPGVDDTSLTEAEINM